ncbi:MAG: putative selenate ABC transporter substrate-binding protein [Actinomycetota bacterium]
MLKPTHRWIFALVGCLSLLATACSSDNSAGTGDPATEGERSTEAISIGAIPDQDPDKLQRLYGAVAEYLSSELGVEVNYVPVTDYTAAVSLFKVGDLDMVWFGGLTGVQARLQVDGAQAILQRDIDEEFHSVFIANTASGLTEVQDLEGLSALKGKRFTFGSEASTSGRLMPQYFLGQAGVEESDFQGQVGFSGSHDKTAELVQAGSFDAGVLNEQVWEARKAAGQVDDSKVIQIFRTPAYHDYHWIARPDLVERDGGEFVERVKEAFTSLDASDPQQAEILELFGGEAFIETDNDNYAQIEEIGRELGLIQ